MSEHIAPSPETIPTALDNLRDLAPMLREADHLEPDAQRAVADLVEELVGVIDRAAPSDRTAHLAERSAQLVEALHRQHHPGLLAKARDRLEEAATRAEAEAPVATGLARRLLDTLSGLGI